MTALDSRARRVCRGPLGTQPPWQARPFPPGMSRLERLPDEIKLRVGFFLMRPSWDEIARKGGTGWDDYVDNFRGLRGFLGNNWKEYLDYNDSALALAATSTRLCNIFLNEHSKKYGLQNTLSRSIESGNVNLVQRAVEYGADINKANVKLPRKSTPLQLAVDTQQLPIILYLLRRGVDKVDELVMEILRDKDYHKQCNEEHTGLPWEQPKLENHCFCGLLLGLMDATLGSSRPALTKPRLPREILEALAPNGRHLWFILRTCMRREWGCNCGDDEGGECPMRLISLLQRYGAKWTSCGAFEVVPRSYTSMYSVYASWPEGNFSWSLNCAFSGRGAADLVRIQHLSSKKNLYCNTGDTVVLGPSVSAAMDEALLENPAYRQDHCLLFLATILAQGVASKEGDLAHAMDLASQPATHSLSIAIVVALLGGGADPNEPGVMMTAMRLACFEATKNAAVAFVTLLLENGADPNAEDMQDEIQGAVEKWWIQSTWQSSSVFHQILLLLARRGLPDHIAWEISAVLGLYHDPAEKGGDSIKP